MLRASKSSLKMRKVSKISKMSKVTKRSKEEPRQYVEPNWRPGLPDEHWGGRMWLRSDKLDAVACPCMFLGRLYYIMLLLPDGHIAVPRERLEQWAGPNLRWCKCIAPEE